MDRLGDLLWPKGASAYKDARGMGGTPSLRATVRASTTETYFPLLPNWHKYILTRPSIGISRTMSRAEKRGGHPSFPSRASTCFNPPLVIKRRIADLGSSAVTWVLYRVSPTSTKSDQSAISLARTYRDRSRPLSKNRCSAGHSERYCSRPLSANFVVEAGDRSWPIPPAGEVRFAMLPKGGPRRNADLRGPDDRFDLHCRRSGRSP